MNTSCDPEKRHRRSIRLRNYDYSRAGVYFITVCTKGQELLFGEVNDGEVELSEFGRMAAEEWLNSARIRIEIELDAWIVMPNHIHGIVIIVNKRCRGDRPVAPTMVYNSMTLDLKSDPEPLHTLGEIRDGIIALEKEPERLLDENLRS